MFGGGMIAVAAVPDALPRPGHEARLRLLRRRRRSPKPTPLDGVHLDAGNTRIVIGSGPGGYIAAIRAAQLGLKTAIVEREHLAGICSNWGCIPTKALLRSAEIYHYAKHPGDYGLKIEGTVTPDLKAIVARSRGIASRMNGGVGFLMKKNKVDVIWGEAKLTKPGEIVVSKTTKKPPCSRRRRCRRTCCPRAPTPPSTSSSPPAPGRARCPASSRTAS
jgi:hypothetical protein